MIYIWLSAGKRGRKEVMSYMQDNYDLHLVECRDKRKEVMCYCYMQDNYDLPLVECRDKIKEGSYVLYAG